MPRSRFCVKMRSKLKEGSVKPKQKPVTIRRNIGIDENSTIQLLKENPKRSGSEAHQRFALYRSGMTVGEFLKLGGTKNDLRWDTKHHFIKILPPSKAVLKELVS
jgi:hypothetical protein